MEIKEKIEELVDKAKNDEEFHKGLKEDPVKAVEGLLGVDLPDEQVKAIAHGVAAKLDMGDIKDAAMDKLGGLFKK
ncbi:hypothetical protein NE619_00610 [Anaerovorax odorimutans]|uniref:Uncharacterized protein n=1 Tax=Anaerovorax odorimutans TaxID=109327 RepID=A0ABT1RJA4_9FIRM|nr:hypothetical protein [Anaerovorax odorimutans]MCQ4635233.1 hypothetical protein [Anaerovorax odorimutans]